MSAPFDEAAAAYGANDVVLAGIAMNPFHSPPCFLTVDSTPDSRAATTGSCTPTKPNAF